MSDTYTTVPDLPKLDVDVPVIEPKALKAHTGEGEALAILDDRIPSEHKDWCIDGENVSHVNIPYSEFLDEKLDESLFEELPEDGEFVVLYAKGHSSEYVVGLLIQEGYGAMVFKCSVNGWANIYEYTELEIDDDALTAQYQRLSSDCLTYLVVGGDGTAVVDPLRYSVDEYIADAEALGAELTYIVDTHIHTDHISEVRALVEDHGVASTIPKVVETCGVDYDMLYKIIVDSEILTVGDTDIETIHTLDHMTGMTTYAAGNMLFTGDGLFIESVTRPDLEGSDEGMSDAVRMLYGSPRGRALPYGDDTIVASAHFSDTATPADDGSYTATLKELKEAMSTLSMPEDELVEFILSDMPPRSTSYIDVIKTNLDMQESDDNRAFELELGPSNCAANNEVLTS